MGFFLIIEINDSYALILHFFNYITRKITINSKTIFLSQINLSVIIGETEQHAFFCHDCSPFPSFSLLLRKRGIEYLEKEYGDKNSRISDSSRNPEKVLFPKLTIYINSILYRVSRSNCSLSKFNLTP